MTVGKPPAFQFYTKEWLSSERVRLLGAFGRGVFVDLLAMEWDRGGWETGSIPDDPGAVAVLVAEPEDQVRAVWPRLRKCFEPHPSEPGRLLNAKLEKVRDEMREYRAKKVSAGQKRWAKKARRRKPANKLEHRSSTAQGMHEPTPAPALALQDQNLAPPTPPPDSGLGVKIEEQERGAAKENALRSMDALIQSFGREDPRDRNRRSTSVPKDPDMQHAEAFRWLITYFPEQSPGAGEPPCVRIWMGRISNHDIVALKRELEAGTFRWNGNGEKPWTELTHDQRQTYITAGLNAMLKHA